MGTLRTPYAPLLAPRSTLRSLKAPTQLTVKMLADVPSPNATVVEMVTTEEGQDMPRDEFMELKKQELRASGGMAISANQMLSALAEKEREKQKKKERKRSLAKDKRALENMTADERARAEKAYLKKVLAEEKRMEKERKAMEAARSTAVF